MIIFQDYNNNRVTMAKTFKKVSILILVLPQALGFQKLAKIDHFLHF